MATCGQYPGRHELLREAVTTYGRALKKLNDDLKDPEMSKADETVLAILMFSLYEVSRIAALQDLYESLPPVATHYLDRC
jgi:hypothetical protein